MNTKQELKTIWISFYIKQGITEFVAKELAEKKVKKLLQKQTRTDQNIIKVPNGHTGKVQVEILKHGKLKKVFVRPMSHKQIRKLDSSFYNSKWWGFMRLQRLRIDGHKCVKCSGSKYLQVHHVLGRQNSNQIKDLETLCVYCHAKEHPNRERTMLESAKKYWPDLKIP